jgi:hypothetical protein
MDRRSYLRGLGVAAAAALAGCGDGESTETTTGVRQPGVTTTDRRTTGTTPATGTPEAAVDRPVVFLHPAVVAAIRERVRAGEEPWRTAFARLIADADEALSATPRSVVDNGAPAGADSPNRYGSDAPYQEEDGKFSDNVDREDYFAAMEMGDWIRDLGQAFAFGRRDRHARKCVDLLHHWFLDPDTRMHPSTRNHGPHTEGLKGQNAIEQYITIPKMVYGAALVSGHRRWGAYGDDAEGRLRSWLRRYLDDALSAGPRGGNGEGDGIYKWWVVNCAVVAAYLGAEEALSRCFENWRTTALSGLENRGTLKYARWRTRGLYYSMSAIVGLTLVAEIARHRGVDLYGQEVVRGGERFAALETVYDTFATYIRNPGTWEWGERGGFSAREREFGAAAYELAHSHWRNPRYRRVVATVGRPIREPRILGWCTLTHGDRFAIDVPAFSTVGAAETGG